MTEVMSGWLTEPRSWRLQVQCASGDIFDYLLVTTTQHNITTHKEVTLLEMSRSKYLLVSLPNSISSSNDQEEAFTALRAAVSSDNGTTTPFNIPIFKIGTLDALVQQADDLAKLSADCETVFTKVGDSLSSLLEGDEDKIAQQKNVNDSMACYHGYTVHN